MGVYFTSDTHFGHENIIRLSKRPFASVQEMDNTLVENWNAVIRDEDTVYHLGDFAFRNEIPLVQYRAKLKGQIHLIIGNHDAPQIRENAEGLFASVSDIKEIQIGNQHIVLCHYPMREWHKAWRGGWHLFGHVHGHLDHQPHGFSLDIGVDSHHYSPVSFEQIRAILKDRQNPFTGRSQ